MILGSNGQGTAYCSYVQQDKQRQAVLPSSIGVLVMPAVDRYGSGELNAHFVYVVNYGRTPNIRAGNEGLINNLITAGTGKQLPNNKQTNVILLHVQTVQSYASTSLADVADAQCARFLPFSAETTGGLEGRRGAD
jgi:hypothetical protein